MIKEVQIKDLKDNMGGIKLQATIVSIQPKRKIWKCFKCNNKGVFKTEAEFLDICPLCGEKASKVPKQGLWLQDVTSAMIRDETGTCFLDLWNDDVGKYQVGDKIQLYDGFAKASKTNEGIDVGRGFYGKIEIIK